MSNKFSEFDNWPSFTLLISVSFYFCLAQPNEKHGEEFLLAFPHTKEQLLQLHMATNAKHVQVSIYSPHFRALTKTHKVWVKRGIVTVFNIHSVLIELPTASQKPHYAVFKVTSGTGHVTLVATQSVGVKHRNVFLIFPLTALSNVYCLPYSEEVNRTLPAAIVSLEHGTASLSRHEVCSEANCSSTGDVSHNQIDIAFTKDIKPFEVLTLSSRYIRENQLLCVNVTVPVAAFLLDNAGKMSPVYTKQLAPVNLWGKSSVVGLPGFLASSFKAFGVSWSHFDVLDAIGYFEQTPTWKSSVTNFIAKGSQPLVTSSDGTHMTFIKLSEPAGTLASSTNFLYVPPIERLKSHYVVAVPRTPLNMGPLFSSFVSITVRKKDVEGLFFDEKRILEMTHSTTGSANWIVITIKANEGVHVLRHFSRGVRFGAFVHGVGVYGNSYAFPAGMNFGTIIPCKNITARGVTVGVDDDCNEQLDDEFTSSVEKNVEDTPEDFLVKRGGSATRKNLDDGQTPDTRTMMFVLIGVIVSCNMAAVVFVACIKRRSVTWPPRRATDSSTNLERLKEESVATVERPRCKKSKAVSIINSAEMYGVESAQAEVGSPTKIKGKKQFQKLTMRELILRGNPTTDDDLMLSSLTKNFGDMSSDSKRLDGTPCSMAEDETGSRAFNERSLTKCDHRDDPLLHHNLRISEIIERTVPQIANHENKGRGDDHHSNKPKNNSHIIHGANMNPKNIVAYDNRGNSEHDTLLDESVEKVTAVSDGCTTYTLGSPKNKRKLGRQKEKQRETRRTKRRPTSKELEDIYAQTSEKWELSYAVSPKRREHGSQKDMSSIPTDRRLGLEKPIRMHCNNPPRVNVLKVPIPVRGQPVKQSSPTASVSEDDDYSDCDLDDFSTTSPDSFSGALARENDQLDKKQQAIDKQRIPAQIPNRHSQEECSPFTEDRRSKADWQEKINMLENFYRTKFSNKINV